MIITAKKTQEVITEFGANDKDTGATEVQCALMTHRILRLTDYVKERRKDVAAKRALLKLVAKRKRFLAYLQSKSEQRYKNLVAKLGLRK